MKRTGFAISPVLSFLIMYFEPKARIFHPQSWQHGVILHRDVCMKNYQRQINIYTIVTDDGVERRVAGDWGLLPSLAPEV